jgi:ectoine hydroxylase-related dioxygenase (phytanoyl-CoA dioxygenase family)
MGYVSADQVEFYDKNGYLILQNVFSNKQAADLVDTFLMLVAAQPLMTSKRHEISGMNLEYKKELLLKLLIELEDTDHLYIQNVYNSIRETPALTQMVNSVKVCGPARDLLARPENSPLYITQSACRIDMPNDSAFSLDWHQEVHYTFKDSVFIQLWAPALNSITTDNGALQILPGSHKIGVASTNDFVPEYGHAQYTVVQEIIDNFQAMEICLDYGDALLLNNKLIHKSGRNSTRAPRLTLLSHYHDAAISSFFKNLKNTQTRNNTYKDG